MSARRAELARLQAAGWMVTTDSPWRRLAAAAAGLVVRLVRRCPVNAEVSTTSGVSGVVWSGGWSR